jgi:chaperone modulatory protein CbpM
MTELVLSISLHELCQCDGLSQQLIVEVVEHGIAQPVAGQNVVDWVFDTTSVHWLRKAVRLHADLEIDWVAVAMVIDLLQQKEALEKRNQYFEQQLKRFLAE